MECDYTNESMNIYFRCRKKAAAVNEKLNSRCGAAEYMGFSESSLTNYETGETKVIPVDKVVLMSDSYNAPELKSNYCKNECPIGGFLNISTSPKSLESIAVRMMKSLKYEEVSNLTNLLVDITADGIITEEERPVLQGIVKQIDRMTEVFSELKIISEKVLHKGGY